MRPYSSPLSKNLTCLNIAAHKIPTPITPHEAEITSNASSLEIVANHTSLAALAQ